MKKLLGLALAGLISAQAIICGTIPVSALSGIYPSPSLDGEESKTVTYLYDGVTRTDYVLSNDSKYKKQVFTTVEFDPTQDDLYFDVCGGGTYLSSLSKTTNTLAKFNEREPDKKVLAATNGEFWMMNNYEVRVEGNEANYITTHGFADADGNAYPANVTRAYSVPHGFNMHDGEIVSSMRVEEELPTVVLSHSFGITPDGEALLGQIITTTGVSNDTKGTFTLADGINRLPDNNTLILYTDKGYAKTYCLADAYEFAFDCSYDYCVKDGARITATLTEISLPGETRLSMKANRLILTARGTRTADVTSFSLGDSFTFSVDIEDLLGNTEKWSTMTDCVGGRMPAIIDGVSQGFTDSTYNPSTLLGIKADGNVVMITSYGRQYTSAHGYYSYGLRIKDYDDLAVDLGIVTMMLCDGGGSATMACEIDTGGYELTGRPCDSGYTERTVINSVLLSVGPPKSGADTHDIRLDSPASAIHVREDKNLSVNTEKEFFELSASSFSTPSFELDLLGGLSADTYKYMVIEGSPIVVDDGLFTMGLRPSSGHMLAPDFTSEIKFCFRSDGTWQRQLIDLSSVTDWSGRMNFIKMNLFADTGVGYTGQGINLSRVKFFSDRTSANSFASGNTDPPLFGDADGSGSVNLADVTTILKWISGFSGSVTEDGDYDRNGSVELADAVFILRSLA